MWNKNLRWDRTLKKIKKHWTQRILMEQSSMCTAISREPLLCHIIPHHVTTQQVFPNNWIVYRSALPISHQLSVRCLLVLLLLSYCSAPHWALPDDNCQWGTIGELIQSRDIGALVMWLLPLGTLFFFFLIGNVFLVDGASCVSLLNMRVEVSPTTLVDETFMTF